METFRKIQSSVLISSDLSQSSCRLVVQWQRTHLVQPGRALFLRTIDADLHVVRFVILATVKILWLAIMRIMKSLQVVKLTTLMMNANSCDNKDVYGCWQSCCWRPPPCRRWCTHLPQACTQHFPLGKFVFHYFYLSNIFHWGLGSLVFIVSIYIILFWCRNDFIIINLNTKALTFFMIKAVLFVYIVFLWRTN